MNRKPVVAGTFYPANKEKLIKDLDSFFSDALPMAQNSVRAIVVPHAGYVFSGSVAADAYNQIDKNKVYKRIFIIASSHSVSFNGASIYAIGNYETPMGEVKVDTVLCNQLITSSDVFSFNASAHKKEHSLEVQLPFLQYYMENDFLLVPIIIGSNDIETPKLIAQALKPYFTDDNLFIISSDFSHYPSDSVAKKVDEETADAIVSANPNVFIDILSKHKQEYISGLVTDICGWSSVLTLLYLTKEANLDYKKISYRNSGDSKFGEPMRVVGYWAIGVYENNNAMHFHINDTAKKQMLDIARSTLVNRFNKSLDTQSDTTSFEPILFDTLGVFVTLHKNGKLRGCIGRFQPTEPLFQLIKKMALASAFQDTRFNPLTVEELKDIEIEISVLTPMKLISDTSEIVLGQHGIYIKKDWSCGTFLPQVANETGWSLDEFLGHCSRDKAGIGWNGWKDAEVYIYEAIVFSETDTMFSETNNEAMYYKIIDTCTVQCMLCPNNCVLKNGQSGTCLARKAENGKLVTLSYGKLVATHVDPIEKKPLYHFFPGSKTLSVGTGGCNLHCKNCQNHHISQNSPEVLDYVEITPEQLVNQAIEMGCKIISYTYNEPTVYYEFVLKTAQLAHENGLLNVIVSNGYINKEPLGELLPYIDAANIDLKCFSESIYYEMSSAHLQPVLETLLTIIESGVWLEITNLIIPQWTNDMHMIENMCIWLVENGFEEVPLHFSRFFPAYKMKDVSITELDDLKQAKQIALNSGIKYVYLGNVKTDSIVTKCSSCNNILITRDGYEIDSPNSFKGMCPKCGKKLPGRF